jgi:hypothetical protein
LIFFSKIRVKGLFYISLAAVPTNLTSVPGSAYIGASSLATPTSSSLPSCFSYFWTKRPVDCPPNKFVEFESKLVSEGLPNKPPEFDAGLPKSDPAGAPPKRPPSAGFGAAPNKPPDVYSSAGFAPNKVEACLFSVAALPKRGLLVFIAPNKFYCFGGSTA